MNNDFEDDLTPVEALLVVLMYASSAGVAVAALVGLCGWLFP